MEIYWMNEKVILDDLHKKVPHNGCSASRIVYMVCFTSFFHFAGFATWFSNALELVYCLRTTMALRLDPAGVCVVLCSFAVQGSLWRESGSNTHLVCCSRYTENDCTSCTLPGSGVPFLAAVSVLGNGTAVALSASPCCGCIHLSYKIQPILRIVRYHSQVTTMKSTLSLLGENVI